MLLALVVLAGASMAAFTTLAHAHAVPDLSGTRGDLDRELYASGRILVQLTESAVNDPAFRITTAAGVVRTGLAGLDRIALDVQATDLERAYIEVADRALDEQLGISRWHMLYFADDIDVLSVEALLEADPNVQEATPDFRAYYTAIPNDPSYSLQWGHNNTGQMLDYCWGCGGHPSGSPVGTPGFDANAQAAWDEPQGYGSSSVVIAILDSGVDAGHPDLDQVGGYDYGDGDSNPDDNSASPGHGTACAGVAAGIANNGVGVAGIAGGCRVMPLKVADSGGSLFFSYIQNGLYHAADNGADVASMSFGAAISSDPATDSALQYAYNNGVTLLAATGNENASSISYPANNQYVIAVGAASPCGERKRSSSSSSEVNPGVNTDPNGYTCDGERWWGSNYGSSSQGASNAVDIIAPTILPTTDIQGSGGYDSGNYSNWFNGTSCATPYAAGVAALIISANPSFSPAQVRSQLSSTAQDVTSVESGSGWDRYTGSGMVDAAAAVGGGGGPGPQAYTTLPYSTGFESGSLDDYWSTAVSSPTYGRIQVTSANGPQSGSYHLTMDVNTNNNYSTQEARLHLDLTGESQVDLEFWWKEFGDETHSQDGVYFSDNGGASFVKVQNLNGGSTSNNTWQQFSLDLDALASSNGLSLTDQFVVRFQQYDNYAISTDGFAFDEISVTASTPPAPTVTVTAPDGGETLTAGTSTSITWSTTGTIANVAIDYSTNGGSSWNAITSSTPNDGSYNWTVPSVATSQGRVRVSDASSGSINDVSDADFTIEVPSGGGDFATLPYSTGFETGSLDDYWSTESDVAQGRIQVTSGNGPHGGSYHLTMDSSVNGTYATNQADLRLDLSGESEVDLVFWWKEFGDETHGQDGVYFSDDDGASFTKVQNLNGGSTSNNTWQLYSLDLDALASSNGLGLSSTFVVRFQQYDNYGISTDGFAFDDISVTEGGGGPGGDYATVPYSTGFDSGSLDQFWSTAVSSAAYGRIQVTTANGPHGGSHHLTMDVNTNGNYSTQEARLHLDLSGESQVDLDFWWKEFGDETHSQDGVYISDDDGASFTKVYNLNGGSTSNNTWQQIGLDLDALASSNGLSLSSTFVVKFQQYDNYQISTDGFAFDDVSVTAGGAGPTYITAESEDNGSSGSADGPVGTGVNVSGAISSSGDDDWFYFDVASAGTINISVAIGSSADLDWFLYDASLTEVARGYTTSNPEAGSYNASTGRYYLRVDGYLGATSSYTLSVSGGLARFPEAGVPGSPKVPLVFAAAQNAPNPFGGPTTIRYQLPQETDVRLVVYDAQGRRVRDLVEKRIPAGFHSVVWDGRDDRGNELASGVYFYVFQANDFIEKKKMSLVR